MRLVYWPIVSAGTISSAPASEKANGMEEMTLLPR